MVTDDDAEIYNFGEVVACYNESFYLLKNISGDRVTKTIFNIAQMTNGGEDFWCFFDTKEELDDYVKWIESPPAPVTDDTNKVVKFKK